MNVFAHELEALRRSWLAWTLGLCLLVLVYLSVYPAFAQDAQESVSVVMSYPPAIRDAFGLSLDTFLSFLGFYGFVLTLLVVAAGIQAMGLGLSSLSKEAAAGTADFLLSKPISRDRVFLGKLGAALVVLLSTAAIVILFSLVLGRIVSGEDFDVPRFLLMSGCIVLVQLWFLAVGTLVSAIARRLRSVAPMSLAAVMGLYVVGSLGEAFGEDGVRLVSPFRYFDFAQIARTGSLDGRYLAVWACVCVASLSAALLVYRGKDIRAA